MSDTTREKQIEQRPEQSKEEPSQPSPTLGYGSTLQNEGATSLRTFKDSASQTEILYDKDGIPWIYAKILPGVKKMLKDKACQTDLIVDRMSTPGVDRMSGRQVAKWDVETVAQFVSSLPGCDYLGQIFKENQIDGEAFLLLEQADIVKIMNIKLGPALKIHNIIQMFKLNGPQT